MSGRRVEPPSSMPQTDISQDVILSKLVTYLRARGRDADLINKLPTGYCSGFATLAAYGQWLEWQPKRIDEKTHQPIPRDDWTWFQSTLRLLARWDGRSKLSKLDKQDIERLLSLVEYFQNIHDYLPIAQGDWHESLTDTQKRQLTKEYSVAGLFTAENLLAVLPALVHEDRMILIGSHNHAVSLLKHEGHYYFYDANSSDGVHVCSVQDVSLLVNRLFSAMDFDQATPSPLGFCMFNFDGQPATYPPHEALLQQVQYHQPSPGYANNTTALHMAVHVGSVESTSIHAAQGGINLLDSDGVTPAFIAAQNGYVDVLRVLAASGADLNQTLPDGTTSAMMAAQNANVLRVLAESGADLNQARLDGITPAIIAAAYGRADTVNFIRSIKQRDSFLSQLDVILRRQLSVEEIKLVDELRGKITKEWGLCNNDTWAEKISTLETKIEDRSAASPDRERKRLRKS